MFWLMTFLLLGLSSPPWSSFPDDIPSSHSLGPFQMFPSLRILFPLTLLIPVLWWE